MSTATSTASLEAKTKTTSPVWAHFGLGASDKGKARSDKVVCRLCAKCVVPKGCNANNLHLRVHHLLKIAEFQKLQKRRGNTEDRLSSTSSLKESGQPIISAAFQKGRTKENWRTKNAVINTK